VPPRTLNTALLGLGAAIASSLLLSGCGSTLALGGAYAPGTKAPGSTNLVASAAPDIAFYDIDSSFWLTYSAVDAVFIYELQNRSTLWALSPNIKLTLDQARPQVWGAVQYYIAARSTYKASPTPAGLTALQTTLSQLQALAASAQAALSTVTAPASATNKLSIAVAPASAAAVPPPVPTTK
jgi:hypothetical protein